MSKNKTAAPHNPGSSGSPGSPINKPAASRSTPMTKPAAQRIQSAVDRMPNPSSAQQGYKSRVMSTAGKK